MSAQIMEKANELAQLIANSGELSELKKLEGNMNQDPQAIEIIGQFQKFQEGIYKKQMSGEELSAQEKIDIAAMEQKMNSNASIKAYIDASQNFDKLMRSINTAITTAISGDQSCDCSSADCGPSCNSGCDCS